MTYILVLSAFFLITAICIFFKRYDKKKNMLMIKLLKDLREQKESEILPKDIKAEYETTLRKIKDQEKELISSTDELKEYRHELELTYNALVSKSSQLEYSNQILERKVENLSNLNSISRSALSVLKMDKIINIIIDAFFVMTGAKRISLYLWENGKLTNKKRKGGIKFRGEVSFTPEEIAKFKHSDYKKIYDDLSKGFICSADEVVLEYHLIVKGKELGVIYIIEDKNKMNDTDEETISALVIQISIAINNAQIYADLLVKERMSQELEVAARIQRELIPKDIKKISGIAISTYFEPAKEIGGDYYDYNILDKDTFTVTIADVSGKGMPAAILMALGRSILKTVIMISNTNPAKEIAEINKIIYPDISEDMFITMMHSKYYRKEKRLYYSNAGHTPLIVYNAAEDKVDTHTVKGVAIGFLDNYKYKESYLDLSKGDVVIFYTDGLTEAKNTDGEMFGLDRIEKVLYNNKNNDVSTIHNALLKSVTEFRGEIEQEDDLTFVILKCEE